VNDKQYDNCDKCVMAIGRFCLVAAFMMVVKFTKHLRMFCLSALSVTSDKGRTVTVPLIYCMCLWSASRITENLVDGFSYVKFYPLK